jgi:hypothetical protein
MSENFEPKVESPKENSLAHSLNVLATIILSLIIALLIWICIGFSFASKSLSNESLKPVISEIKIHSLDSTSLLINKPFIDTLSNKIQKFNEKIEALDNVKKEIAQQQEKNENFYKLFLALLSSVFAIVGFFGFKSIHDTRQAAVEKAVSEAKKEAILVAKVEAEKEAKKEAKNVAEVTSKKATIEYLNDNLKEHTKVIEKSVTIELEDRISLMENEINKYLNPKNYNESERPQIFNDINNSFIELDKQIKEIKNRIEQLQNDNFKKIIINEILEQNKTIGK